MITFKKHFFCAIVIVIFSVSPINAFILQQKSIKTINVFRRVNAEVKQNDSQLNLYESPLPVTIDKPQSASTKPKEIANNNVSDNFPQNAYWEQEEDAFSLLAGLATTCILECERKRDAIDKVVNSQPSSATNWIDEKSSFVLKQAFDKIQLKLAEEHENLLERDEANMWLLWMKASPAPAIIELSNEFRSIANQTLQNSSYAKLLEFLEYDDILSRISLRLFILPSGSEINYPIRSPTGSICFGRLLYGGVTRFRLLSDSSGRNKKLQRRAAERTVIMSNVNNSNNGAKKNMNTNGQKKESGSAYSWVQHGGPDRKYEAVDMGPAAVLELMIQPRGSKVASIFMPENDMVLIRPLWNPQSMFSFDTTSTSEDSTNNDERKTLKKQNTSNIMNPNGIIYNSTGKELNDAFEANFRSSIGGLQPQIQAVIRRVLDGRVIQPGNDYDSSIVSPNTTLMQTALEAEELALLGLSPVRGMLLHGPPGCGKTAMAREISRVLSGGGDDNSKSPRRTIKIVAAPELLDRWVGGSERLIRDLFADAEAELKACGGDASKSSLHVIIIDEIDAVFRKRSLMADDSGEATRNSAVNQILAKLDGVNAMPNVLMIGMTNRRALLDEALLRSGRLEVQIEIPLPDKNGRREILQIQFDSLRKRGRLSQPLCMAIDGSSSYSMDKEQIKAFYEEETPNKKRNKRKSLKRAIKQIINSRALFRPIYDLAADGVTGGYSGADLAGLVRCAGSIALSRSRMDSGGIENLLITLEDVKEALIETKA